MIVLIDNGHGANTPGKCSPDKQICIIGEDCAEINGLNKLDFKLNSTTGLYEADCAVQPNDIFVNHIKVLTASTDRTTLFNYGNINMAVCPSVGNVTEDVSKKSTRRISVMYT